MGPEQFKEEQVALHEPQQGRAGTPLPAEFGAQGTARPTWNDRFMVTAYGLGAKGPSHGATGRVFSKHGPVRALYRSLLGSLMLCAACLLSSSAQPYSVSWSKVAGGGGTSTGGTYAVRGSSGQQDAGRPLAQGQYAFTGGFWVLDGMTPTAPGFRSPDQSTFVAGVFGSFTFSASGDPEPTFTTPDPLPEGVNLTLEGVLSGTPASGTAGTYPLAVKASNGVAPDAIQAFTLTVQPAPATVVARHLFYNHSAWDGRSATAEAQDDGAIAPDKEALRPGGTATFAHYSSYSRGLNGIMIDIESLPGVPEFDDFEFKRGNSAVPATWSPAPPPLSITVRAGAGPGGSDRITLVWVDNDLDALEEPNEAVAGEWLQVQVRATARTGLAAADVFYFGSAPGEVGNRLEDAFVDSEDVLGSFYGQTPANAAGLTSVHDVNRDGAVDTTDVLLSFHRQTGVATALTLLDLRSGGRGLASQPDPMSPAGLQAVLRGEDERRPALLLGPVTIQTAEPGGRLLLETPTAGRAWRLQAAAEVLGPWTADPLVPERLGPVLRWPVAPPENAATRFYRVVAGPEAR